MGQLNTNIGTLQRLVVSILAGILEQDASTKERTKLSNVIMHAHHVELTHLAADPSPGQSEGIV